MSDYHAWHQSIVAEPRDLIRRLAFADWLDENAKPDFVGNSWRNKAELVRLQIENDRQATEEKTLDLGALERERELLLDHLVDRSEQVRCFDSRCHPLWRALCVAHQWGEPCPLPPDVIGDPGALGWVRGGFVEKVETTLFAWMRRGHELVAVQPVLEVAVRGMAPMQLHDMADKRQPAYYSWLFGDSPTAEEGPRPVSYFPVSLMAGAYRRYAATAADEAGVVAFRDQDQALRWFSDMLVDYARIKADLPPLGPSVPLDAAILPPGRR